MSGVLVIAEQRRGELRPATYELIGAAQALRRGTDEVSVAVLAAAPEQFIGPLRLAGVDEIITAKVAAAEFDPDTFEAVVGALIAERRPEVVLMAHSVDSFGYAAALAARLGLGFATDVFNVERIDGELVATRGGYGQKVNVEVDFPGRSSVLLAIRGNVYKAPEQPAAPRVAAFAAPAVAGRSAARVRRIERGRRRRHDGGRVHPDHRPRHRRGVQGWRIQGARGRDRRHARLLAADRGRRMASEEPPGRPIRQDGQRLQALHRHGSFRRHSASRRDEARGDHRRSEQ